MLPTHFRSREAWEEQGRVLPQLKTHPWLPPLLVNATTSAPAQLQELVALPDRRVRICILQCSLGACFNCQCMLLGIAVQCTEVTARSVLPVCTGYLDSSVLPMYGASVWCQSVWLCQHMVLVCAAGVYCGVWRWCVYVWCCQCVALQLRDETHLLSEKVSIILNIIFF